MWMHRSPRRSSRGRIASMTKRNVTAAALAAAVCILGLASPMQAAQVNPPGAQQAQAPQEMKRPSEIVLPQLLETGKPATLAVIDSEGSLTSGVTVTLSTGRQVTTDASGRARFVVTSQPGPFFAEISGTEVRASSLVVATPATSSAEIVVSDFPRVAALNEHFSVHGSGFRGDPEMIHATLGGRPVLVLACSPVSMVIQPGTDVGPGPAKLTLEIAGKQITPVSITMVTLQIEWPGPKLAVGKKGQLLVHVTGTDERLALVVRNLSANNIELAGGDVQRVTSSGGPRNVATITMRAIDAGNFAVTVRLMPTSAGALDVALIRAELLAARELVPTRDWQKAIDAAVANLENMNSNRHGFQRVLEDVERMLSANPPPEIAKHLQTAWLALLRP